MKPEDTNIYQVILAIMIFLVIINTIEMSRIMIVNWNNENCQPYNMTLNETLTGVYLPCEGWFVYELNTTSGWDMPRTWQ